MSRLLQGGQHDWLGYLQPTGLVVAPAVLARLGLWPEPQGPEDNAAAAATLEALTRGDAWPLFGDVLGWPLTRVAGAPGGPGLPDRFGVSLRDGDTLLEPHLVVNAADESARLLVRIEAPGTLLDQRGALDGWQATPQQRFERLLRETGTLAGVLIGARETGRKEGAATEPVLRLVVAPKGEASGHLSWPLLPRWRGSSCCSTRTRCLRVRPRTVCRRCLPTAGRRRRRCPHGSRDRCWRASTSCSAGSTPRRPPWCATLPCTTRISSTRGCSPSCSGSSSSCMPRIAG